MTIAEQLAQSYTHKPSTLVFGELKWRYLYRSVLKGKNILLLGDSGCGKTLAAISVGQALQRIFFAFNCGSMQDPRSALIGNTQFDKEKGTFFAESDFIRAIKTPNSVILLDEITRCHPDGWNILMTALDPIQRYVRLDEMEKDAIVKVADGVTFIATANVGNQYTATRELDRAVKDRFSVKIEVDSLTQSEELSLLQMRFPNVEPLWLSAISDITSYTRTESKDVDGKITNYLSTRAAVEMAELISDGFTIEEIAETAIYPNFSDDGGADSERSYITQYVQKYVGINLDDLKKSAAPINPISNTSNKSGNTRPNF
jgi:MoxR-like ATPase